MNELSTKTNSSVSRIVGFEYRLIVRLL